MKIENRKISGLAPDESNPRFIKQKNLAALTESMKEFGLLSLPIFNERTGMLVSGHQRLKALLISGMCGPEDEIPVVIIDAESAEAKALLLSLNNKHSQGSFTEELQNVLDDVFSSFENIDLLEALGLSALRKKKREKKYDFVKCPECQKWFSPFLDETQNPLPQDAKSL